MLPLQRWTPDDPCLIFFAHKNKELQLPGNIEHRELRFELMAHLYYSKYLAYLVLTVYHRCVRRGESTASMIRTENLSFSIRSNRRTPWPRKRGAQWIENSSTNPALWYCWIVWAPPEILMSFRPATSRAWRKALSIPSLTKWNVMPPFRYHGLRDSWVRTNTGVWNGASSGQLTSPSSNILFPMIYAPVLLKISSTSLSSAPVSPSSPSLRRRLKLRWRNNQLWISSPVLPSGLDGPSIRQ